MAQTGPERGDVVDDRPSISLAGDAETALRWAAASAIRQKNEIGAWHVVYGVLLDAKDSKDRNAGRFVWDYLAARDLDPLHWFEAVRGLRLTLRPEQPAASFRSSDLDAEAFALLEDAADCAMATGGSGVVEIRHILGAALLGPKSHLHKRAVGSAEPADVLNSDALASALLRFIVQQTPTESEDWVQWSNQSPVRQEASAAPKSPDPDGRKFSVADAEPHVHQALFAAKLSARDRAITGTDVIEAIAAISPKVSSAAFRRLLQIADLRASTSIDPNTSAETALVRDGLLLDETLERHLVYAQHPPGWNARTATHRKLWGRDLVTAALLSSDELRGFFKVFSRVSLEKLRDEWYAYITAEKKGLRREQVDGWWKFAGVPTPSERAPEALRKDEAAQPAPSPGTGRRNDIDAPVKAALTWAFSAARQRAGKDVPDADVVVTELELLGGLFKEGAFEGATGLPALDWRQTCEKLGLPDVGVAAPRAGLPRCSAAVQIALARALATKGALAERHPTVNLPLSTWVFLALFVAEEPDGFASIEQMLPLLDLDADQVLSAIERQHAGLPPDVLAIARDVHQKRIALRQIRDRPDLQNDRVSGAIPQDQDLLDASRPALRFAKLLTARGVKPPIALGLFGNWGSGKTFFMGLMRDHINDLAKNGGDGYVRRVVQIEFNAWHYHDTNLWASLAMRIFDELARELGGATPTEVEAKRRELHQRMESSKARRVEASERRDVALKQRSDVAQKLEEKRAEREALKEKSVTLRLKAAWEVVTGGEQFAALRQAADTLSKEFGITAVLATTKDLEKLRREISETTTQASGLLAAIGHRFRNVRAGAATLGLLLLTGLSIVAMGWGVDKIVELVKPAAPIYSGTLVQIAGLISAAVVWCGRRIKDIRGVLEKVGKVEEQLETEEKNVVETKALKDLTNQVAALDEQIHKWGEELSAAEREIAAATAELDRINQGGMVYDFLQDRRAANSYVGQLGLISTIRQDFEKLGRLLQDFATQGRDPIERVVLYIDDLDRCHPDKVVEVLQAVHLLLAFDLFNVVVGVDARWLERSLNRQYIGAQNSAGHQEEFSPQDYLEKIFQIPYALGPIGETNFKNLIGGMIETRADRRKKEEKDSAKKKQAAEDAAQEAALAAARVNARAPRDDQRSASNAQGAPPIADASQGAAVDPERDRSTADAAKADEAGESAPSRQAATRPGASDAALVFEDHEEEYLQGLHAFVDRPRLAKRLVNIYRLLRVRADDEGRSATFFGSKSGEYRAAMILLAINVGHPKIGPKVMRAVELASEKLALPDLLGAIATNREIVNLTWSALELKEIDSVVAKLGRMANEMKNGVPMALAVYKSWAPKVACYSFDWHREAPAHGQRSNAAADKH